MQVPFRPSLCEVRPYQGAASINLVRLLRLAAWANAAIAHLHGGGSPTAAAKHSAPRIATCPACMHAPVQLSMEGLRQLQQQAAALRVEMPEQSSLALALDRVDVWQVSGGW